jgi:glycosylphosphatidylinositol transamidase (GPIT) subunit GPI8
LKTNGFTDDDIILIMRDDIAHHPKNTDKGAIRVEPNGANLYFNVKLDYRADTISVEDIEDILIGNKSDRLSTVLESTETDNVLLYWTGHGTKGAFSWLETKEKFTAIQLRETVQKMYDNKLYQSMLICAEPCYSGSVVKDIEGIPLVLAISAADENESSFADNFNPELGVWMCDRFTNSMMRILEKNRHTNFSDLYEELHNSTLGSHVCVHNIRMFYYLQICTLSDYFYVYNQ